MSPPPVTSKEHPTREPEPEGQQLRARASRAGRGGRPRSAREGGKGRGGTQGRVYKRRHSASSLLRRAESATRTVGKEGGSRKGERNCRTLRRSGSRLLIYSLPLFLLPSSQNLLPSFLLLFLFLGADDSPEREKRLPFRFPSSSPPPPFPPWAFPSLLREVFPGGHPDGF